MCFHLSYHKITPIKSYLSKSLRISSRHISISGASDISYSSVPDFPLKILCLQGISGRLPDNSAFLVSFSAFDPQEPDPVRDPPQARSFPLQNRHTSSRIQCPIIRQGLVAGPWTYYTVDDGQFDVADDESCLMIGTLESYEKMCAYFEVGKMVPVYIEVPDGIRLLRAVKREENQKKPDDWLCRRYLADEKDFSEENLETLGNYEEISEHGYGNVPGRNPKGFG